MEEDAILEETPYTGSEYIEIPTGDGHVLRVVFEMSLGDLVVSSVLLLILSFLILRSVLKLVWR